MKSHLRLMLAACLVSAFLVSTATSTDIKVSRIGGGYQIGL